MEGPVMPRLIPILICVLQVNMHVMEKLIPTRYSESQPVGRMS